MGERRWVVTVSPAEAARLQAFEEAAPGRQRWPLGENRGFRRLDASTFVVEEWLATGGTGATVTTRGTATLHDDGRLDVVVAARRRWLGWSLAAIGVAVLATTPRDGALSALLGIAIVGAAWALFLRRSVRESALDGVEEVLRHEVGEVWEPVDHP